MKELNSTLVAALAGLALSLLAGTAQAQYKPTGDDGITASPRLRQQLDERKARTAPAVAATRSMACPKCQDTWVSQPDTNPKGVGARVLMGKTTKLAAQHQCRGCGVDWSIVGTGKLRHSVAIHKCSESGSENLACCSLPGSGHIATRRAEQSIQIAPLK